MNQLLENDRVLLMSIVLLLLIFLLISLTKIIELTRDLEETVALLSVNQNDIQKQLVLKNEQDLREDLSDYELKITSKDLKEYNYTAKLRDTSISLSASELLILYRIVEAEATGGSFESKVNVTNVIINRLLSKDFPNTIKKVVFERKQFSPITDGRYYSVKITKHTINAVQYALNHKDTTYGSTFFMYRAKSGESNVSWFDTNLTFVFKDNLGHEFFK